MAIYINMPCHQSAPESPFATFNPNNATPPKTKNDTNPYRNRPKSYPASQLENPHAAMETNPLDPQPPRRKSVAHAVRTRSLGYGGGVIYERAEVIPPTDDDIVIVNVRLSDKLRRDSEGSFSEELIPRPPNRNFFRRLSTRFGALGGVEERLKAVKMPRRAYKAFFAKDKNGEHAGTEPEREWDERDLEREFGAFADCPLQGYVHATMCTNRAPLKGSGWSIRYGDGEGKAE